MFTNQIHLYISSECSCCLEEEKQISIASVFHPWPKVVQGSKCEAGALVLANGAEKKQSLIVPEGRSPANKSLFRQGKGFVVAPTKPRQSRPQVDPLNSRQRRRRKSLFMTLFDALIGQIMNVPAEGFAEQRSGKWAGSVGLNFGNRGSCENRNLWFAFCRC